jgi:uncharacterized protein YgiM (DUF1202 family)
MLVMLAFYGIYLSSFHNFIVHTRSQIYSAVEKSEPAKLASLASSSLKKYMESIAEETNEYVWTTGEVKYRKGPDKSYKSAGTLTKDTVVRRTGITHNGWNRVTIDYETYYVPGDSVTADAPINGIIYSGIKGEYQKYAFSLFADYGWGVSELQPLINLWERESHWNPSAHNRRTGAHGIPQALPGSKMASEGSDYYTNAEPQIRWGL